MRNLIASLAIAALAAGTVPALAGVADGKLNIVTEGGFPPWNYTDASGKVLGFEMDLVEAICAELKFECTIESQTFDAMIPGLDDGKYDMIVDALGMTAARMEVIDFSVPYAGLCYSFASVTPAVKERLPFEDRIEFLTDDNLQSVMDMYREAFADATIGTLASGTSTRFVAKNLADVNAMPYKTPAARDLDLKAGRVDVIFASKDSLIALKKRENIEELELVGPCLRGDLLGYGGVGVGLKKGNTELKVLLDPVIEKFVNDGTIKRLSEEHFGIDMSPIGVD